MTAAEIAHDLLNRVKGEPEDYRTGFRDALLWTRDDVLFPIPELNESNYAHNEVCELNRAVIEAFNIVTKAIEKRKESK